jgi:hypothetical protein
VQTRGPNVQTRGPNVQTRGPNVQTVVFLLFVCGYFIVYMTLMIVCINSKGNSFSAEVMVFNATLNNISVISWWSLSEICIKRYYM